MKALGKQGLFLLFQRIKHVVDQRTLVRSIGFESREASQDVGGTRASRTRYIRFRFAMSQSRFRKTIHQRVRHLTNLLGNPQLRQLGGENVVVLQFA